MGSRLDILVTASPLMKISLWDSPKLHHLN